jgi:hypothetical protein
MLAFLIPVHVAFQIRAMNLVEKVAAISRGPGGEPFKPLVVEGILRLLQDMNWGGVCCSNPPLGCLNICKEAAMEGCLCTTSFPAQDIYHNIILRILESCGTHPVVASVSCSVPTKQCLWACATRQKCPCMA